VSQLRSSLVSQFGHPRGVLGRLAGLIMTLRASNRERNRRTVELLDIRPTDDVLEVGFGPGLAIEQAVRLATQGKVFGLERSELMLRQACRRNAKAIREGKVDLRLGSAECMPDFGRRFDKIFAVNVYMFWDDPVATLRSLRAAMKPGGTLCLTLQPRHKGATDSDARKAAEGMAESLRAAGLTDVRSEILTMKPVDTAFVRGRAP